MSEKRIFVTGGASGLGKAIALRFAKAGFKVCIGDLNSERGQKAEKELCAISPDSFYITCNVTDEQAIASVRDALKHRWGGIDVVVNNAGIGGTYGAIEDVDLNDWQRVFDINLLGVIRGIKIFTPAFKSQGGGHFVNIASAAGLLNPPMMSNYNAAKAAVISVSETMRVELGLKNINTTVVCPAFFKTNLMESMGNETKGIDMNEKVNLMMSRSSITAENIADDIYSAVLNNVFYIIPHKNERRLWAIKRWLPTFTYNQIYKKAKASMKKASRKNVYN